MKEPTKSSDASPFPRNCLLREHRRKICEEVNPAEYFDLAPHVHFYPGWVWVVQLSLSRRHSGYKEPPLGSIYSIVSLSHERPWNPNHAHAQRRGRRWGEGRGFRKTDAPNDFDSRNVAPPMYHALACELGETSQTGHPSEKKSTTPKWNARIYSSATGALRPKMLRKWPDFPMRKAQRGQFPSTFKVCPSFPLAFHHVVFY